MNQMIITHNLACNMIQIDFSADHLTRLENFINLFNDFYKKIMARPVNKCSEETHPAVIS